MTKKVLIMFVRATCCPIPQVSLGLGFDDPVVSLPPLARSIDRQATGRKRTDYCTKSIWFHNAKREPIDRCHPSKFSIDREHDVLHLTPTNRRYPRNFLVFLAESSELGNEVERFIQKNKTPILGGGVHH